MWNPFRKARQSEARATQVEVVGRPDYYQPYGNVVGYLPPPDDPEILASLRRAIPMLSAATDQLVRLTGNVKIVWDSERVQAEWDAWISQMRIAPLGLGFNRWLNGQQERALIYGTGVSEILLDGAGRDVRGCQYLSARSVRLKCDPADPTQVIVSQQQAGKPEPVVLDRDFVTINCHAPRDDTPYGRSLFSDIPFVSELLLEMTHALKLNWQRTGAPSFAVIVNVPPGLDPSVDVAKLMREMLAGAKTEWVAAMTDRKTKGKVRDFFAAGDLKVVTIGADGMAKTLEFEMPWRSMMEQIVSVTHLPPWMLGLNWSTTERLSDEQAQALEAVLCDYRDEYTPSALFVANWWARVRGVSGTCIAEWPEISLRNRQDAARASYMEAQAASQREQTGRRLWQAGVYDQQDYASYATGEEVVEIANPMAEPPAAAIPAAASPAEPSTQQDRSLTYGKDFDEHRGCRCQH